MESTSQHRRQRELQLPEPPFMHIVHTGEQRERDDDNVSEYQMADDMTVHTNATMDDRTARRKYGLNNWRKYALHKHGNNPKFLNSAQGREILKANFRKEVKTDLDALTKWIDSVDRASVSLEEELHETRVENAQLIAKIADVERLLGIKEQLNASADADGSGTSDSNKIQYVLLLEKKLSVSAWEIEELRAEVMGLKQQKNNDIVVHKLKQQLESVTMQRDELLSDRGARSRDDEERERSLITQLEELSRARAEMVLECSRVESDSANRVEALFGKLEVVQRQRDDLLNEQRMWRREKEELMETMSAQINDLSKQKDQLSSENFQLRQQIVHLTPINVEASAHSRYKPAPASTASDASHSRAPPAPSKAQDGVPEKKPPSASLKAKLEEWNKQRDRMVEEQHTLEAQEVATSKNTQSTNAKTSVQSVLNAISPSTIMGHVKKLTTTDKNESKNESNGALDNSTAASAPASAPVPQVRPIGNVRPISFSTSPHPAGNAGGGAEAPIAPVAVPTAEVTTPIALSPANTDMEAAKNRINEILAAEDSDDEDLAISAALSRATNLVEEVRGGSGMSK